MTTNEPAESPSASIVNVAAIANVSTATVSRVLSGKRTKDDDIARRVRAAAHSLNYSVNFAASALRSTVTRTIGLIVPSVQDPFSARLIDTLEPLVNQSGRQLALSVGRTPEVQKERIVLMAARHVDGLIVVPLPGVDLGDVLAQYAQEIPAVQIGGLQHTTFTSDPAPIQPALQQIADEILRLLADQSNTPVHVNLPSRLIAPGSQDAEINWAALITAALHCAGITLRCITPPSAQTSGRIASAISYCVGTSPALAPRAQSHGISAQKSDSNTSSGLPLPASRLRA